jgi:hypothetical protein
MLAEYRQLRKQGIEPIEELMAEAEINLENVQTIRDFVQAFSDKKITVEKFKRGPVLRRVHEDEDDFLDFDELDEMEIINSIFR